MKSKKNFSGVKNNLTISIFEIISDWDWRVYFLQKQVLPKLSETGTFRSDTHSEKSKINLNNVGWRTL